MNPNSRILSLKGFYYVLFLCRIRHSKEFCREVIAKVEAQGMVSKSIGIMLGIGLAHCIGSSTFLACASFSMVTGVHMFRNLTSYQSIQIRTLNSISCEAQYCQCTKNRHEVAIIMLRLRYFRWVPRFAPALQDGSQITLTRL
ncbi:hypothetical protein MKX01_036531 [Papaver californicum]|nr:hypothetical protein MKX01_036531 [Papaver californicum]